MILQYKLTARTLAEGDEELVSGYENLSSLYETIPVSTHLAAVWRTALAEQYKTIFVAYNAQFGAQPACASRPDYHP